MDDKAIFEEKQYFRQIWIWAVMLIGDATMIYYFFFKKQIDSAFEYTALYMSCILMFGLTDLIFLACLHTRITKKGIHFKFFPFINTWKTIN